MTSPAGGGLILNSGLVIWRFRSRVAGQERTLLEDVLPEPKEMMVHFYSDIIESILTSSIHCQGQGQTRRIIHSAEVIGCNLPSLQDIARTYCVRSLTHKLSSLTRGDASKPHAKNTFLPSAAGLMTLPLKSVCKQHSCVCYMFAL